MKKRYILLALISIVLLIAPYFVQAESYGDITCTEKFVPVHKFECRRPDMSIDKVFQTYEQMVTWYSPPLEETFIPEITYVYGSGTTTYTYSGN